MGDPRQEDVDEARRLVEQVEREGAVALPALSAAELCVLGAMQSSLIDQDAGAWWTALPDAERITIGALALRFLLHRRLLEPPDSDAEDGSGELVPVRVRPLLGFVLAGRIRPAFVAIRREGADAVPDPVRLYGIADESGLRTVLVEAATHRSIEGFGPGYEYVLSSPAGAVGSLVRWVGRIPASAGDGPAPRKILDVYRPVSGRGPIWEHLEIERGPAGHRVERTGGPIDCDGDALGDLLLEVLCGRPG